MIKNILVAGLGGVGGYFGGLLSRAGGNRHISFLARGAHLEAIRQQGLILDTDTEKGLVCRPDTAVGDVKEAPQPDLCIMAVKGYDLEEICHTVSPVIGKDTFVLPLLNGVDIRERIRSVVRTGIVLPACVYVSGNIIAPGRIVQRGPAGSIVAGADPDRNDISVDEVKAVFDEGGIPFSVPSDPYPAIWKKFLFIAAYGLVTAYSRKNFGELLADDQLVSLTRAIIEETAAVARKKGVSLPDTAEDDAMDTGGKFPAETRTSFQRDVEAGKAKNEGDLFGGTVIRMGRELGIPTPVTERVYAALSG